MSDKFSHLNTCNRCGNKFDPYGCDWTQLPEHVICDRCSGDDPAEIAEDLSVSVFTVCDAMGIECELEPKAKQIAESIISGIRSDSHIPNTVSTFSEVHEYCDANTLGDSEQLLEEFGWDTAIDILNRAQNLVNDALPLK